MLTMKWLLFCFLNLSCFSPKPGNFTPGLVANEYLSSVRILTMCITGPRLGSGVIIDNKHVLTAKHVVMCDNDKPALMITVRTAEHKLHAMGIDRLSTDHDVARLVLPGDIAGFRMWARLTSEKFSVGEQTCLVTGDEAIFLIRKCGEIGLSIDNNGYYLLGGVNAVPGNSGSAFWTTDGRVFAILTRARWEAGDEKAAVGIPLYDIQGELLNDIYPGGMR